MSSQQNNRRRRGRPSIIGQKGPAVLEAIALGANSVKEAALYAECSYRAVERWIARGRTPLGPWDQQYVDFVRDYERARVRRRMARLARIEQAGRQGRRIERFNKAGDLVETITDPGDWRAMAWLLAREFPELYAEKSPLFLLQHLRRLAASDEPNSDQWQHLMDVVARSLASLKPFGPAAERPQSDVDEAELKAALREKGVPEDRLDNALEMLSELQQMADAPDAEAKDDTGAPLPPLGYLDAKVVDVPKSPTNGDAAPPKNGTMADRLRDLEDEDG